MSAPRPLRRSRALPALLAATIVLTAVAPAAAWDPEGTAARPTDPPATVPAAVFPLESPGSAPFALPAGVYPVNDAYAGDVVWRDGPVTRYDTATVRGPTDAYARVLDTVAAGAPSVFDGAAFNGRSVRADGRPVAGTYYEGFFRGESGLIPFGIVFFQDDAERSADGADGPAATPSRVEVLRGRRVALRLPGLPAGAVWRFVGGGEAVVLGALEGGPADPFVARWDRLPAPGASWTLRFAVTVGRRTQDLAIEVAVRSPGLVE